MSTQVVYGHASEPAEYHGSKSYDAKKNTDVSAMGQPPSVSEQMVTRAYTWFGPLQDMQAFANETGVCLKLAKDFVGYYLPGAA